MTSLPSVCSILCQSKTIPFIFSLFFCFLLIVVLWASFVPKAFDTIHKEEKKRKKERKKNLFSL